MRGMSWGEKLGTCHVNPIIVSTGGRSLAGRISHVEKILEGMISLGKGGAGA